MAQNQNNKMNLATGELRLLLISSWTILIVSSGFSIVRIQKTSGSFHLALSENAKISALFAAIAAAVLWFAGSRMRQVLKQQSALAVLPVFPDPSREEAFVAPAQSRPQQNELLASMNHEIRTPLSAIVGIAEAIEREPTTSDIKRHAQTLVTASHHLDHVVNSFLQNSLAERLFDSQSPLEKTACDLASLIEDRIDVLKVVAEKSKTKISCNIAAISNQTYLVDQTKFSQLLLNLVSNAIKFANGGDVEVRAFLTSESDKNVEMRVEVRDSGIGLTDVQISNLFRRFAIAGDDNVNPFGVTGLGLVKSQQIVKLMKGKISVKSLLGEGSVFTFEIPLERAVGEVPPLVQIVTPTEQTELIKDLHVLVAEDNSTNQIVISSILKFLKVPFTLVTDGEAAVKAVKEGNFDLVLMDCQMPITDGYEAARKIRAYEQERKQLTRIPIIALTASSNPDEQEHCLRAGMDLYTTKPISSNLLKKALIKVLPTAA